MVSFNEAIEIVLDSVEAINDIEVIKYDKLLNRVAAQNVYAIKNLPSYNNSAMDGYAFRFEDLNKTLKIAKVIYAGDILPSSLKDGECYKIMTGAKVPDDADTIAPNEICEVTDDVVTIKKEVKRFNALRFMGEEIKEGEVLIKRGEVLNPSKIALLASQGITSCQVYRKLTIAIVSSGDELKEPWEEASVNEIYNINAINLQMHLKEYGFDSTYLGKIPDNFEDTLKFIKELKKYDVIISSGGISKGDKDYIIKAFRECGFKEFFSGINVKPGHPTTFGKLDKSLVLALPGNPLATILNFLLIGLKAIYKMQGAKEFDFKRCKAKSYKELKLKPNRTNIVLGKLEDGYFIPYKDNRYGSGMISPLVESNCVAIFNESVEKISKDEEIEVLLIK